MLDLQAPGRAGGVRQGAVAVLRELTESIEPPSWVPKLRRLKTSNMNCELRLVFLWSYIEF